MVTKEQALELKHGQELHTTYPGWPSCTDSHSNTWRVNGRPKVWKRSGAWRVPIKFGLHSYDYVDQDNHQHFHLASECPERGK